MEHLSLEIFNIATPDNQRCNGSQYAVLPPDATITFTDTSEIFASGDVWSYSFSLNMRANAHIFGTSGEIHGARLHEQINKRKARLWVEGIPLYLGYLKLDSEAEVDGEGNIEVSFESGQKTFDELIEGAKANQVPMIGDVQIGMALWRKRWIRYGLEMGASIQFADNAKTSSDIKDGDSDSIVIEVEGEDSDTPVQEYPRMVFPKGVFFNYQTNAWESKNFLNTDDPYTEDEDGTPTHPYCNVALCYQKQGYEKKDDKGNITSDYNSEPEAQRGYEVMPANRVNSAPNFYVLYWIRALMKHLGIHIEENQMLDVEDLRRLFFVNTNTAYDVPQKMRTATDFGKYGNYGMRGRRGDAVQHNYVAEHIKDQPLVTREECKLTCTGKHGEPTGDTRYFSEEEMTVKDVIINVQDVKDWKDSDPRTREPNSYDYINKNRYLHNAFAKSDCFPNAEVSEVISAIENGFGVRFIFSDDYQRVRIVLLKNIFQSDETQTIDGDIVGSDVKQENGIRGFRLTYGKGKEDTHFFYKGFADLLPHEKELWPDTSDTHDYSSWSLNEKYADLLHKVSAFNKTCYVTPNTGDAYGVKVDKDAKRYDDLHQSLFEFAGFMDAEDGDCTGEDDTIQEVTIGFTPVIMNDLNMEAERDGSSEQIFALFVDEKMRPRRPDLNTGIDYNNSDAEYDVNRLYDDDDFPTGQGMMSEGVIKPGEFHIQSDAPASFTDLSISFKRSKRIFGGDKDTATIQWNMTIDLDGHINEGYRLYLQDNYEPNDDGISPIESHDWGLTLGIMRGSGGDARVDYEDDPEDGEGNDTWEIAPGSSVTAHPDTCDNYGNEWRYIKGEVVVDTAAEALQALAELFPHSNAPFNIAGMGYISSAVLMYIYDKEDKMHSVMFVWQRSVSPYNVITWNELEQYVQSLQRKSVADILETDATGRKLIVEVDSSSGRIPTLTRLCGMAYGGKIDHVVIDNGVDARYGRLSLKLRAEKPNPYYDKTLGDIVNTKAEAGVAMQKLYTDANTNLLTRPRVSNATMRAAGWDAPESGYATVYSMGYGVQYNDGTVHEILWTPIKENGTVLTPAQMQTYVDGFNNLTSESIASHDTQHLLLDIDTTEERAEVLHQLQEMYYAQSGESVSPVDISGVNPRYLQITNKSLRGRGICDQLYKEYSYWVRNARIVKRTVKMTLAQFLAIDKTKRVRVGDVIGFIRKMQFGVSNQDGLGLVTMEILYI